MAIERALPSGAADERAMLTGFLDFQRATLAIKYEGLADAQLRQQAVPPSTLSLLGLVRHMAEMEGQFRMTARLWSTMPWSPPTAIRAARLAVYAAPDGEGPLVAQLGGDPMLPSDIPEPYGQFVGAVDCALLPLNATDLPLPSDGQLLFFGDPDVGNNGVKPGRVIYVPAGTPVTRRPVETTWRDAYEPQQLRTLWHQLSWPCDSSGCQDQGDGHLEGNSLLDQLDAAWSHVVGWRPDWTLQIGGHPDSVNWDPVQGARGEVPGDGDWVLLATWQCGPEVEELEFGVVHWVIRRQDLVDLRFNRVYGYVDMV